MMLEERRCCLEQCSSDGKETGAKDCGKDRCKVGGGGAACLAVGTGAGAVAGGVAAVLANRHSSVSVSTAGRSAQALSGN